MAVPKRKVSRARRGNRRSHDALRKPAMSFCPRCAEPKAPHRICPNCNTYKGKSFLKEDEE